MDYNLVDPSFKTYGQYTRYIYRQMIIYIHNMYITLNSMGISYNITPSEPLYLNIAHFYNGNSSKNRFW